MKIKITYIKVIEKTNCYLVDGMYIENKDVSSIGYRVKSSLWIPCNLIELNKDSYGKVLEYFCNEKGNVAICKLV